MQNPFNSDFKVGILGGGQLGKMLCQAASPWHLNMWVLDQAKDFPAGPFATQFIEGNFKDYDDVMKFGSQVDLLTIEIEHVNTRALTDLVAKGKIVHADPLRLETIKDKGTQKLFYQQYGLPTSPFELFEGRKQIIEAVQAGKWKIPFVQKSRTAGYDGQGVLLVKSQEDLGRLFDGPSLLEQLVPIQKELSVVVAQNPSGDIKAFPVVEMEFNPEANLVEYLFCPAQIDPKIEQRAIDLAVETIKAYKICGLLAVELFLTNDDEILINEVAPRPHNSGHHTIEANVTSQYEQHLRGILDLPLGDTSLLSPAVMVNLLGADGFQGQAVYENIEKCLEMSGVHVHIYGKKETRPFRKMGHVTVVNEDLETAKEMAKKVKETLIVKSNN